MSAHEPVVRLAGIPLQTHVAELRRRCEAVSRLQGGATYFHEELAIFNAYAGQSGLYLAGPPTELSGLPDDEGNEHQIWYIVDSNSVFKATWPDFFGLLVVHRRCSSPPSTSVSSAYPVRSSIPSSIFARVPSDVPTSDPDTHQNANIQHPTSNAERRTKERTRPQQGSSSRGARAAHLFGFFFCSSVQRWMFGVRCSMFAFPQ
jgi:hypothetical protein